MEVLAKGQLSYMILSCLSERDMYGLELIDEIKKRYGREIKLPSLYSNLNRMKELKYISSYLKESTKGPKCSYSSITEAGRNALENLKAEFDGFNFAQPEPPKPEIKQEAPKTPRNDFEEYLKANTSPSYDEPEIEKSDDYDDYFALSDDDETESAENEMLENEDLEDPVLQEQVVSEEIEETQPVELQEEIEEEKEVEQPIVQQTEPEPVKEEPAKENVTRIDDEEYNQRLYNAARDFSRNRSKRSYTENQIELSISPAVAKSPVQQEQDLSELKTALLQSKEGHYQEIKHEFKTYNALQTALNQENTTEKVQPVQESIKDDGVFITERLPESAIPKPKKIEPPRLNITLPTPGYDKKLPAPKRNVAVDPTCSDVRAKIESLYAKAEVKKEPVAPVEDFEDYDELANYYDSQGVNFKVYERPQARPKHNTNLLNLYVSLAIFAMVGVGCALFYMIFSLSGLTRDATNFVYYLFPIIALVYVVYNYYTYKTTVSKVPKQMWHPAIVWSVFALLVVLIFLINYACGAAFNEASTYFSTILVPIFASACATVGIYYAQIYAYKKFWK